MKKAPTRSMLQGAGWIVATLSGIGWFLTWFIVRDEPLFPSCIAHATVRNESSEPLTILTVDRIEPRLRTRTVAAESTTSIQGVAFGEDSKEFDGRPCVLIVCDTSGKILLTTAVTPDELRKYVVVVGKDLASVYLLKVESNP